MGKSSTFRIWPPEPVHRDAGLEIRAFGLSEVMEGCRIHRPKGTGDHLIMAWHHSVEVEEKEGVVKTCRQDELIHWPTGALQSYGREEPGWSHSWIHLRGDWFEKKCVEHSFPSQKLLPSMGRWVWFLQNLYLEYCRSGRPDPVIVRHLLEIWMLDLVRTLNHPHRSSSLWVQDLKNWLLERLDEEIALEDCCRRVGLGSSRLCSVFKKEEGIGVGQWIQKARLEEASMLLKDFNLTVAQVAHRVGYRDVGHFGKHFRRRFGCAPGKWRHSSAWI